MPPSLQTLTEIEPAPRIPIGAKSTKSWSQFESELGFEFPEDYKQYVALYGAGRWADFLGVMSPFYEGGETVDFWKWIKSALDGLDEMHSMSPNHAPPFFRYPARSGLIPIGFTDNGGTICWQADGPPEYWSIVCLAGKLSLGYDKFNTSLTGFLVDLLRERISPKTFPPDLFPIPRPAFRPYPA